MRIVDRATFLAMPSGTVFSKYQPLSFDGLAIKGDTVAQADFVVQDLIPWFEGCDDSMAYFDALDRMESGGNSPPLDYDCAGRDGLFDQDQLFAVFDADDVKRLIDRLTRALHEASQ